MSDRFSGRVALVTGGASGIGAATVRRFAAEGARVVVADLSEDAGRALADEVGGVFQRTDVTSEASVAAATALAVERFGRLDIMVNNAGVIGAIGSILETSAADWSKTLAIMLDGVFYGTKHAGLIMRAQNGGVILNTTSVTAMRGSLGPHSYSAAKHAVVGLTKTTAAELSRWNIRVNAVAPGMTMTALITGLRGSETEALASVAATSAFGTALMPDEIAGAFAYFASGEAAHVTGEVLTIDSGAAAFGGRIPELLYGPGRMLGGGG